VLRQILYRNHKAERSGIGLSIQRSSEGGSRYSNRRVYAATQPEDKEPTLQIGKVVPEDRRQKQATASWGLGDRCDSIIEGLECQHASHPW
jgi:hypothetical protein